MPNIIKVTRFLAIVLLLQSITLACKQAAPPTHTNTTDPAATKTYTCTGNEPFWMVKIEPDSVVFKTPENEVSYPSASFMKAENKLIFETQLAHATMSSKMKVTLVDTKCADSMSGIESPYTVTVERDGETYTGCGRVE